MIDTPYILQLKKQYKGYLKNVILGKAFEPLVLRGGKDRPQRYEELDRQVRLFQQFEKGIHPQGWSIEWEDWTSKKVGKQLWPSVIKVDTEEDYLFLIDKQEESGLFKEQLERLCGWKPGVRDFLYHKPEKVLELKDKWTGICGVIDYLLTNDVAGMYLRSLVVPVHTKFIEEHKGIILDLLKYFDSTRFPVEAKDMEEELGLNKYPYLFEARWLDNELAAKYTAGMKTFAVEASYLGQVQWIINRIILVENKANLYQLPPMPGTFAIFSSGKALHLLKEIELFRKPAIFYWGDLDEEGFNMLHHFRSFYPHTKSLMMDEEIVIHHFEEKGTQHKYKQEPGNMLSTSEQAAFNRLKEVNGRIEQEKLQLSYVMEKLSLLACGSYDINNPNLPG